MDIREAKDQSNIDTSVKDIQTVIDEYKSQKREYITQVKVVVIEEKNLKAKHHKVIICWGTA